MIRPYAADRQRNKLVKQGKISESKVLYAQIAKTISEEGRLKASMFKRYCDQNASGVLSEM